MSFLGHYRIGEKDIVREFLGIDCVFSLNHKEIVVLLTLNLFQESRDYKYSIR